ncbi:MAG: extracellular solute-binding protein, partial [Smithella sp.]
YYEKMMGVFSGTENYDIVMVAGHLWMADFIKKGYLAEIRYDEEDILPVIADEMKFSGKNYLSPSFCDGHMIVYRKSIVKEVLGKEPGMVITPQEYIDTAKAISENRDLPAIAMKADSSEIFTDALPFLRMFGEDVYDAETTASACDKDGVIRGLEKYCKLKKYAVAGTDKYGNNEIAAAIKFKKTAMAVTWSGQLGVVYSEDCLDKEDLGFATFDTSWNVTWSFAVSENCRHKEEAEKLLTYLRSPEVDSIAGALSGAPVRKKSYLDGMDKYPWYQCQLEMIKNAKPLPKMDSAGVKHGFLYKEIAEAFAGRKSPGEAMRDAKSAIDKL